MPMRRDTVLERTANQIVSGTCLPDGDVSAAHHRAVMLTDVLLILDRVGVSRRLTDQIATIMYSAYQLGRLDAAATPKEDD